MGFLWSFFKGSTLPLPLKSLVTSSQWTHHIKTNYCGTVVFSLGFRYLTNINNLLMLASPNIIMNVVCNGVIMVKEHEENIRDWSHCSWCIPMLDIKFKIQHKPCVCLLLVSCQFMNLMCYHQKHLSSFFHLWTYHTRIRYMKIQNLIITV